MAIQNVTKMWSKEGGNGTSAKYDTFAEKFSHTEGYQVLAEIGDTVEMVASAAGIPQYGQQHPTGVASYVRSKDVTPLGPIFWQVIVGYEGVALDSTVDIEWSDATSSEPIDRDFNGRAITTVNGEQVEGLSVEISDPVAVIRRKFFSVNAYTIGAYRHATNSDEFLGWPPGTARLVGYSAKNQFKNGAPLELWDVTARIQFRFPLGGASAAQAWHKRWRHEGLYAKLGGVIQRGRDDLNVEVSKPVLLKLDGTQERDPDNAVFFYTQIYGSIPYSGLGLL
jgi:hypothetical protein